MTPTQSIRLQRKQRKSARKQNHLTPRKVVKGALRRFAEINRDNSPNHLGNFDLVMITLPKFLFEALKKQEQFNPQIVVKNNFILGNVNNLQVSINPRDDNKNTLEVFERNAFDTDNQDRFVGEIPLFESSHKFFGFFQKYRNEQTGK